MDQELDKYAVIREVILWVTNTLLQSLLQSSQNDIRNDDRNWNLGDWNSENLTWTRYKRNKFFMQ